MKRLTYKERCDKMINLMDKKVQISFKNVETSVSPRSGEKEAGFGDENKPCRKRRYVRKQVAGCGDLKKCHFIN